MFAQITFPIRSRPKTAEGRPGGPDVVPLPQKPPATTSCPSPIHQRETRRPCFKKLGGPHVARPWERACSERPPTRTRTRKLFGWAQKTCENEATHRTTSKRTLLEVAQLCFRSPARLSGPVLGRKACANEPKSGPKLPGPPARAVWGRVLARSHKLSGKTGPKPAPAPAQPGDRKRY
jgi:hypothetical protein